MEKENKIKSVVPALRFPEFQNTEGWKEYKLKSLCEIGNGKDYKHLGSGNIPVYGSGGYMTSVDDFLYDGESVCIGRKGTIDKPIFLTGKFWTVDTLFYTHSFYNCLPKFLYLIFQQINWYKYNEAGGVPSLSKTTIGEINVFVPVGEKGELKEQQKIVDCIFSLDELIEATAQKVEALKEYKKGLMQRLFPAEGKDVPDLRFPEFLINATWNIVSFAKYIKLFRGSSPRPIKEYLTDAADGINWIKIGDTQYAKGFVLSEVQEKITKRGAEKSRYVHKGELVLANSMSFGKTYLLAIDGCIYDGWFVLRGYEEAYYKPFLLQILNSDYVQNQYKKLSAGGIVLNISSEIVYQTHIFHTSIQEQKKIANCLSSLDELIEATSRKVEILKDHKKGLIQQLFPKI